VPGDALEDANVLEGTAFHRRDRLETSAWRALPARLRGDAERSSAARP